MGFFYKILLGGKKLKRLKFIFTIFIITILNFSLAFSKDQGFEKEILKLVNVERKKVGLAPLTLEENLNKIAQTKVKLVIKEGKLNHLAGGYKTFGDFIKDNKISYLIAGENLATKTKTSEETMKLWMSSKGHRANILNPKFTQLGVARDLDKNGNFYWVQIFIKPLEK